MLCTNLFSSQILFKLQSNGTCESIVLADVFRYCTVLYSCSVAHYSCSGLLFCISLHCTLLCCIILHLYLLQSAALYCTVLCFTVLHFAFTGALFCAVLHCPPNLCLCYSLLLTLRADLCYFVCVCVIVRLCSREAILLHFAS
jgi:hypothetical protein